MMADFGERQAKVVVGMEAGAAVAGWWAMGVETAGRRAKRVERGVVEADGRAMGLEARATEA